MRGGASAARRRRRRGCPRALAAGARAHAGARPVEVVAIGVLDRRAERARATLLPALPADLPVPIVIVQHMPPLFTRLLAERLDAAVRRCRCARPWTATRSRPGTRGSRPATTTCVVDATAAQRPAPLNQAPPENSCRPAVDVLFRSVAEVYGARALAVVLTGMGQDGLRGCEAHPRRPAAQMLAQDEATSVVWGMPGCVARAGLADAVLPLDADRRRDRAAACAQRRLRRRLPPAPTGGRR